MANKDMDRSAYMNPAAKSTMKQGRVSQKTISEIKSMGMEAAIKKAKEPTASPEFIKGTRRMYADRFFQDKTYKPNGVVFTGPSKYAAPATRSKTARSKDISDKSSQSTSSGKGSLTGVGYEAKRQAEIQKAKKFISGITSSFGKAYLGK